jgi:hypothetical protein
VNIFRTHFFHHATLYSFVFSFDSLFDVRKKNKRVYLYDIVLLLLKIEKDNNENNLVVWEIYLLINTEFLRHRLLQSSSLTHSYKCKWKWKFYFDRVNTNITERWSRERNKIISKFPKGNKNILFKTIKFKWFGRVSRNFIFLCCDTYTSAM